MKTNLNKLIATLKKQDLEKIKMICFDSDGVTAQKGTDFVKSDKGIMVVANQVSQEMETKLRKLTKYFLVNITSGRSLDFLQQRYKNLLTTKLSLQGEIGNMGWWSGGSFVEEWDDYERDTIKVIRKLLEKEMVGQDNFSGFEPKDMIITVHAKAEIPLVVRAVEDNDRENRLYCWWNGEAYDIGPRRFHKGTGLKRMCGLLGLEMNQVMTVGNGVNDESMKDVVGIDVSTDQANLSADFVIKGEHLGGIVLIDRILDLMDNSR